MVLVLADVAVAVAVAVAVGVAVDLVCRPLLLRIRLTYQQPVFLKIKEKD